MDSLLLVATIASLALGTVMSFVAWRLLRQNAERRAARIEALQAMVVEVEAREIFVPAEHLPAARWPARLGMAAAIAGCVALPFALYSLGVFGAITSASPSTGAPIELLSLRHATDDLGVFTVTGLVQNPTIGRKTQGVIAVVYLFDDQGRFLSTGRAPLDAGTLQPGDEATFTVAIPKAAGVGKYRVGFRHVEGGVIPHIDKRGQAPAETSEDAIGVERGRSTAIPLLAPGRSEGE